MPNHALLRLLVLVLPALISATCYAPDGSLSKDVPCNPTAAVSLCCTAGFYCLSNFLCSTDTWYEKGSNKYIRGTCTDKTWSDPACGNHCTKENKSGGEWVMQCDGGSDTENPTWCCANDKCCDKSTGKFHMANGTLLAIAREIKASLSSDTLSGTSFGMPSATPSLPATSTDANVAGLPTNVEPSPSPKPESHSNNVALGVGVGIAEGVGVVLVTAGGIWLYVWLKRRRQAKRSHAKSYGDKEVEAAQTGYLNELEEKNCTFKEQQEYEADYANRLAELPVS